MACRAFCVGFLSLQVNVILEAFTRDPGQPQIKRTKEKKRITLVLQFSTNIGGCRRAVASHNITKQISPKLLIIMSLFALNTKQEPEQKMPQEDSVMLQEKAPRSSRRKSQTTFGFLKHMSLHLHTLHGCSQVNRKCIRETR